MTPNHLTARQKSAYDRTVRSIRDKLGSWHSISLRIYMNSGIEVTGETVRVWFMQRKIPTDIAFVLYEVCESAIDPLTLCPWLREHVEMKAARGEQ